MTNSLEFDVTQEARVVVIVAMSARSGSSWLVEQLKQSEDFVHFRGELTTFLRKHRLTPQSPIPASEALAATDAARADMAFRRDLSLEVGYPLDRIDDPDRFAQDILRRLPMQWPQLDFNGADELVGNAIDEANSATDAFDDVSFSRKLLGQLASIMPLDPLFHDFGQEPDQASDICYPFTYVLESPPFLNFAPWRRATIEEVGSKPLVIKSAGDVYRLDFYRALFPNANLRVLHLRRNPAASINGLMNAWLSRKYQSFRVGGLSIKGYSDLATWREQWWKLDLAPGWENYRDASLPELCEWQWRSAQEAVLNWCETNDEDPFVARYEDMMAAPEKRAAMIADLCDWLSVPRFVPAQTRLMNASTPPRKGAWRGRSEQIVPLIESQMCRTVSIQLGYGTDHEAWF
ncbi:hypothetical protein [Consotaella aegiceratis]|uniref:hypothetical protein n=1 Tax=Consotaella aegiceratis TaxID=3097961 RepID=UPI002F3E3722